MTHKPLLLMICVCLMVASLSLTDASAQDPRIKFTVPTEWIPKEGNFCDVTVSLKNAPSNSWMTFQLLSTNWPGTCMNAGFDDYGTDPDLAFPSNQASKAAQPSGVTLKWYLHDKDSEQGDAITVEWESEAPTAFLLRVNCYDYGAIGKINAGLYNGAEANGKKQYVLAHTMIPHATGKSKYIADEQKSDEGWIGWDGSDSEDSESGPADNPNAGDGLTAFEEYRGFEINGKPLRTSPLEKERDSC